MSEAATRDPGGPARGRVLIVRPEPEFLAVLQAALPDVDIDAVPGKMSALVQLRARDYDAVITDPVTSVREDLTFAAEIHGIRPRARVLVLAPVAPQADLIAALRAQVFACFGAPFNVDEIVHMAWFDPNLAAYLLERPVKSAEVTKYNINLRRLIAADNAARESGPDKDQK